VGVTLRRRRAKAGALSEPAPREVPRSLDVRIGSSTNALRPISSAERSLGAGTRQWLGFGAVAAAAVAADQLTKQIVSGALSVGEEVHIVGPLSIHHVHNSGIAFGLFSDATSIVIGLTTVAVSWMLLFFARSARRHPILPVALGFVLGGSISNLLDRIRLGHVTDFLDVRFWPAFNLADSFIVVGVAILFAALAAGDRPPAARSRGASPLHRA
jgi:signal peptidase II